LRKLHLRKKTIDKLPGYELRIRDRNLTIQDFLCEVNDFFENAELQDCGPKAIIIAMAVTSVAMSLCR